MKIEIDYNQGDWVKMDEVYLLFKGFPVLYHDVKYGIVTSQMSSKESKGVYVCNLENGELELVEFDDIVKLIDGKFIINGYA